MDLSMIVTSVLLIIIPLGVFVIADLYEGDKCAFDDATEGTCKLLTNCPSALELLKKGVFPKKNCGFIKTQAVVCCKEDVIVEKATSEKITTTTENLPTRTTTQNSDTGNATTTARTTDRLVGDISRLKCKEYQQYAYDKSESPTLSIISHFANTLDCAFDRLELIAGGTLASRKEFPHMALIGYKTGDEIKWNCGGSLISEYFILTAAHCLESRELGKAFLVRLGVTSKKDNQFLQERKIVDSIPHPEYVKKYHDIALLRLSESVHFDIYVRPACLQVERDIPYTKAIASGWGKNESHGRVTNDLLKVVLEFFDVEQCNQIYKEKILRPRSKIADGILDHIMLCAGSPTDIKDTCEGDSGGPLQVYHNDSDGLKCMYDIVGVTAFGMHCALRENQPGVYTRVSNYIDWIENIVWPH